MKKRDWMIPGFVVLFSIIIFLAYKVFTFHGAVYDAGTPKTITTTIYATLITILLALLALAVTAYVFVAGFLKDRQKPYEKNSIDGLLRIYTGWLVFLTISSLFSLLCCFLIDNADKPVPILDKIPPSCVITLSVVVSIFLFLYTLCIICHDCCLHAFARHARKKLFPPEVISNFSVEIDYAFKWIGDLEKLVERLIQNHRDDFHSPHDERVLSSITGEEFAKAYDNLLSYRNYLWVEGCDFFTYPEYHSLRGAVRELENQLRNQFLKGERMQKQSFTAPFLSRSKDTLHLEGCVFTNTVFERDPHSDPAEPEGIDFHGAKLQGADFTHTRLNYVNLRGAKCKEAVFSDAVLNHIQVDTESCFERAVFLNTDFARQKFCDKAGVIRFTSASFANALLTDCRFVWCDLRQAVFHQAAMSSVTLDSVCLSYADLSGAILTNAKLIFQQETNSRFDWETYWLPTQIAGGRPLPVYTDSWEGRKLGAAFFANLEKCVLSQVCIEDYNFVGSRLSDANFSDARLKYCILDRCYGQRATFQETLLENCRFSFAMFSLSDFSHAHLFDCDFSDCDLRDSLLVQTTVGKKGDADSRFCKANFTHAQVRGSHFNNCDFTLALFADADLRDTEFKDCNFTNVSFTNCNLRGARFLRCNLDGADFRGLDPTLFELIGCTGAYKLDKSPENPQEME